MSAESPSAASAAPGELVPSSQSDPQLSCMCAATDDSQQSAGAADPGMSSNPEGSETLEVSASKPGLPVVHLKVACGDMIGTLLVHKGKILMYEGTSDEKEVSPTEFERLGGRSATKKWKQSIRLVNDDGEQGRPVGEWYVMQGLEQPKKPREIRDPHLSNTGGPASPKLNHHDTRHTATSSAYDAAPTHKRPVRSTRGHVPAKHLAAEVTTAPSAPTGRASGCRSRDRRSTAAGAATQDHLLEGQGPGTADYPGVAAEVAAVAEAPTALSQDGLWLYKEYQQQQGLNAWEGQLGPTTAVDPAAVAATAVAGDEATDIGMDHLALGELQPPVGAGASNAGPGDLLVQVPVSAPLPGDATQAVVEMTAYLEGRRSIPPWRLLPQAQRPLVGRLLVPLRQLLVMVLQAGGYVRIKDDLLTWQAMATELGLPAWPCPDVPDPLRVLQQVYRDYLLRFEGRFSFKSHPGITQIASPTAQALTGDVGSASGVVQPALPFDAAEQNLSWVPAPLPALMPGAAIHASVGAMAGSNNSNTGAALVSPSMQQQQLQLQSQQVQPQSYNSLPAAIAAEGLLDGGLSGDLLDLLTDLIPDSDAADLEQGRQQQHLHGIMQPAPQPSSDANGRTASAAHAIDAARQHPEMARVQQRQRLQQLQQQLKQTQQACDSSGVRGPQGAQLGASGATESDVSVAAAAVGDSGRSKRPAPLIRCGDSDLVSLMDQTEVAKLLQEYELQQQRHISTTRKLSPQLLPSSVLPNPKTSQLATAIVGAVDRNMSKDLHAIMQQFYYQQQQRAQQLLQQQGGQGCDVQQPAEDEEMSGMLEALQLAGEAAQQGAQVFPGGLAAVAAGRQQGGLDAAATLHASEQLIIGPDGNNGWPGRLLGQASVGAHLMGELVDGSSSIQHPKPAVGSHLPTGVTAVESGTPAEPAVGSHLPTGVIAVESGTPAAVTGGGGSGLRPLPRPGSSTVMAPPAPRQAAADQLSPQQRQPGVDDFLLPGYGDSLLRLTTPTSALMGEVLDSPTLRSNPSGQGWMDLSGLLSVDHKSMTAELSNSDVQQQTGGRGGQDDDLAAVLRLW